MTVKFLVFSGTTEGKDIAAFLESRGASVTVFVATEYGLEVMPEYSLASREAGRMDEKDMEKRFTEEKISGIPVVIDATHPYAKEVSLNLKQACENAQAEYFRLLRPSQEGGDMFFPDTASAAAYLNSTEGAVLLTIGSKELAVFSSVKDYDKRLFFRVLPAPGIIEKCFALGYSGKNIICAQGSFSKEMNAAIIRRTGARYLVTKDTGEAGGFAAKLEAAAECGTKVMVIKRPEEKEGYFFDDLTGIFESRFGLKPAVNGVEGKNKPPYFPIFVSLEGRKILVIGGGKVAERRTEVLLDFGADISLVSPSFTDKLARLSSEGFIKADKRPYREDDITKDIFLVVAASDNGEVNGEAAKVARKLGIPVNRADRREESDFYFPAIAKGSGIISGLVSENGNDHISVRRWAEKLRNILNG